MGEVGGQDSADLVQIPDYLDGLGEVDGVEKVDIVVGVGR